jgi:hypothetical protein
MNRASKNIQDLQLENLKKSPERILKTRHQITDLEKVCRLFGICYIIDEPEIEILSVYIKNIENSKREEIKLR